MTIDLMSRKAIAGNTDAALALLRKYESALGVKIDDWQKKSLARNAITDLNETLKNIDGNGDAARTIRSAIQKFRLM